MDTEMQGGSIIDCFSCCSSNTNPRSNDADDRKAAYTPYTRRPRPSPAEKLTSPATRRGLEQKEEESKAKPLKVTLTCFNEADQELRDLVFDHGTRWEDALPLFNETFGASCMLAYDNGVGVDLPIDSAKEWDSFLHMVATTPVANLEYDVLLLPAGSWLDYKERHEGGAGGDT